MVRNSDGYGMSQRQEDGTFKVFKGWSIDEAWKKWNRLGDKEERIFHARVSTHGGVSLQNLHPFDASYHDEGRLFYHNGTVNSIPQFVEDRSDSYHVATMLKSFPTTKRLIDEVARLAVKEVSRFVLCLPKETWHFGNGWITRDGVMYSNGSALGAVEHKRRVYAGGLLHAEGTLAAQHLEGFKYDPETKFYKPDPDYKAPTQNWDEKKEAAASTGGTFHGGGGHYSPREDWDFYYRDSGPRRGGHRSRFDDEEDLLPANYSRTFGAAPARTKEQVEQKVSYRWLDDKGRWLESKLIPIDGDPKKMRHESVVVDGPHPGTVRYAQPNSVGIGIVLDGTEGFKVLGRYKYEETSEEVRKMFNLVPFHLRQAEEDAAKAAKADEKTGREYTSEVWAAITEANEMPCFDGWSSKDIKDHYKANGGSLFPLPK